MKLKVGDIICQGDIWREITEVRRTGYSWKYVSHCDEIYPENIYDFISENSNDPFFDWGWKLLPLDAIGRKTEGKT